MCTTVKQWYNAIVTMSLGHLKGSGQADTILTPSHELFLEMMVYVCTY